MKELIRQQEWGRVLLLGVLLGLAGVAPVWAENTFPSSGNVGIGTASPSTYVGRLVSFIDDATDIGFPYQTVNGLTLHNEDNTAQSFNGISFTSRNQLGGVRRSASIYSLVTGRSRALTADLVFDVGNGVSANPVERMRIDGNGNVGIGTAAPTAYFSRLVSFVDDATTEGFPYQTTNNLTLHNEDNTANSFNGIAFTSRNQYGGLRRAAHIYSVVTGRTRALTANLVFEVGNGVSGNPVERMRIDGSGNVGIGTASPSAKLHVAGDVTVDGNIAAKYQDVAEWVQTPSPLSPGTVVAIDPLEGNRVLAASKPYDTRVAGVVSSRPGLLLGEAGEDKAKVAHSGRVKVKVDAKYGSIAVGDLLVTSPTPGHAMRSTPADLGGIPIHRPGTLLGKALEPLEEGRGEILVLLTLK